MAVCHVAFARQSSGIIIIHGKTITRNPSEILLNRIYRRDQNFLHDCPTAWVDRATGLPVTIYRHFNYNLYIHKAIVSPHVLELIAYFPECSFTGVHSGHIVVVERPAGLSLADLIFRVGPEQGIKATDDEIAAIMLQLMTALTLFAERKIVHRGLVPSAIHLTRDGYVKIGDFVVAKSESDHSIFTVRHRFQAPEIAEGPQHLCGSDVYSVGLLALASGLPVEKLNQLELNTARGRISQPLFDFCSACLVTDPVRRPSAKQLLENHPFLGRVKGKERQIVADLVERLSPKPAKL